LKQVDHPNIVKLYDIYEDEDNYYLIMELMTGGEVR
jgi:serine/threonine protein kinase